MIYLYFFQLLTFLAKKLQNFAEIPCSAITQSRQLRNQDNSIAIIRNKTQVKKQKC